MESDKLGRILMKVDFGDFELTSEEKMRLERMQLAGRNIGLDYFIGQSKDVSIHDLVQNY